jgi:A/G-specific adenine glycosylase
VTNKAPTRFAAGLLGWYDRHGRKDLPWKSRDPYRVWVSEIMLQQTRVETVIPYYQRFLRRFPDVRALARAPLDEVLHEWTGLGYYARARHLHMSAQIIMKRHGGDFPRLIQEVSALPGIGRSTAGAIRALAFGQRHAILDGNVTRVLARYYGVLEPPARVEERLWRLAARNTPPRRVAAYTQAIMDLGALICRRTPDCPLCPLKARCIARRRGLIADIPARSARQARSRKAVQMVMLRHNDAVLLERRPPAGIWGGLWSLPECADVENIADFMARRYGLKVTAQSPWSALNRSFTHFDLRITPVPARLLGTAQAMEDAGTVWYKLREPQARGGAVLGLAAPVKLLLEQLRDIS